MDKTKEEGGGGGEGGGFGWGGVVGWGENADNCKWTTTTKNVKKNLHLYRSNKRLFH